MNFEEFLKKSELKGYETLEMGLYINRTQLGNWAFEKAAALAYVLKSGFEKDKREYYKMSGMTGTYYLIAEGCLGKEEVERRLEKLKGDKQ